MNNILPWPALIGRLRFLMDVDQAQFAGHLGVDEPTVKGWERGIMVPERRTQKILRDKLHRLEPAISAKAIEMMPVISAVHSNTTLALCCVASQPYADIYKMRVDELRYLMIGHLWTDSIAQAADTLAGHEAWKGGECAYVRVTIQQPDGHWAHYAASPIGTTNMALWIGGLCERPEHLSEGGFDLTMTTLDDVLLD
jgi:transcriptional regulator with XRE-family HTH domain